MRLAIAQINSTVGDIRANEKKILAVALKAKGGKADCVVFPEMAVCGYPPEDLLLKDFIIFLQRLTNPKLPFFFSLKAQKEKQKF